MLSKAKLKEIAIPQLPKSRTSGIYKAKSIAYICRSAIACNGELLVISFFERESALNGFTLPSALLYMTKTEYITQVFINGHSTWKTGRIRAALELQYKRADIVGYTAADETTIEKFLGRKRAEIKNLQTYIENFQSGILADKLVITRKKRFDEYNKLLTSTPSLPDAFMNWIDKIPLKASRYVYYKRRNKNESDCFCTYCRHDFVELFTLTTHNEKGVCPHCNSAITYKATGRTTGLQDEANVCIIQKTTAQAFVMRFFCITRYFTHHHRIPKDNSKEYARIYFDKKGQILKKFKYGFNYETQSHGLAPDNDPIIGPTAIYYLGNYYARIKKVWYRDAFLYPHNMRGVLKDLSLSFKVLQDIKEQQPMDLTSNFIQSVRYPIAANLEQLGLETLKKDLLNYGEPITEYTNQGSLTNRLGITKQFLQCAKDNNWGAGHISAIASCHKPPPIADVLALFAKDVEPFTISELVKYTTFTKVCNYINKQAKKHPRSSESIGPYKLDSAECTVAKWWKDYLKMCKTLKYNMSEERVLFPKDIKHDHDAVQQLIRIKYDAVADKKLQQIYPSMEQRYSFDNGKYIVCTPRNFDDFITEGASLLHCVCTNGYFKGNVRGDKPVFFIREKQNPSTPFFTMEYNVKDKKIEQLRGYRDRSAPDEVSNFAQQWLAHISKNKIKTSKIAA